MDDTKTERKSPSSSQQSPKDKKIRQGNDSDEKSKRATIIFGEPPIINPGVSSANPLLKDSTQQDNKQTSDTQPSNFSHILQEAYVAQADTVRLLVSGDVIPLQAMANLVIRDKREQPLPEEKPRDEKVERKSSIESKKTKTSRVYHDQPLKDDKPIAIENLFAPQGDKPPVSKVLIEGPAGSGKSTLGQRLVYVCSTNPAIFNKKKIDYVLWLPLRTWLAEYIPPDATLAEDIAAFIYEQYLKGHIPEKRYCSVFGGVEILI